MSKFELQQGDYVMASDIKDEAMHNELREAFRASGCSVEEDQGEYLGYHREDNCIFWGSSFLGCGREDLDICQRRVYPDQILGKDEMMLIEALKPGMRAKILTGIVYHNDDGKIVWKDTGNPCNVAVLMQTEYEIIKDDTPWKASENDKGYVVGTMTGSYIISIRDDAALALRTKEAAKQMAKIQKVYTALMNMPGAFEGESYHVYSSSLGCFEWQDTRPDTTFDIPFDTENNAKNAASYANKLRKELQ
jgi:hypothetical protein